MKMQERRALAEARLIKVDELIAQGVPKGEAILQSGFKTKAYYYQCRKRDRKPMDNAREVVAVTTSGHSGELKHLRTENQRLRIIVSDLMLDKQALVEYANR